MILCEGMLKKSFMKSLLVVITNLMNLELMSHVK